MIRMTAPAVAVLSRKAMDRWLQDSASLRARQMASWQEDEARRDAAARRARRTGGVVIGLNLVLLGVAVGPLIAVTALLLLAISGSVGRPLPDGVLVFVVWLVAGMPGWALFAKRPRALPAVAAAALIGGQVTSAALLPDRFPPTAGLPALLGLSAMVSLAMWRSRTGGGRQKRRRDVEPGPPPLVALPALHLHGRVAALVERCNRSGPAAEILQGRRAETLGNLEISVAAMTEAAAERRFSGFWNAVEAATRHLEALREVNDSYQAYADLWSQDKGGDQISLQDHLRAEHSLGLTCDPDGMFAVSFDDGSVGRASVFLEPAHGTGTIPLSELPGTLTRPQFALDLEAIERLEHAYGDYAKLLLAADKDHEMASIGQEFLNRQVLREGFSQLARTIAGVGAALCLQVERSQTELAATIERSTDRLIAQSAAQASQQSAALQASLGRLEDAARSVRVVYSING